MFLLIPKKIRIETTLTPTQCRSKLNRELVDYTRRPSLIAASEFIKKHRFECCYFGSFDKKGRVEIFYHRVKKHDGSSAGFFGRIEKRTDAKGSVIVGKIRRSGAVVAAAVIWLIACLLLALSLVALKEYVGAGVTAAVAAIGLGLIAYDGSESYVRSYLDSFPQDDVNDNEGNTT